MHIKPFLGHVKLSQLTAPMVREFEDKLRRGDPSPGETEGKARSPAMVHRIITSLSTMISDAQSVALSHGTLSKTCVRGYHKENTRHECSHVKFSGRRRILDQDLRERMLAKHLAITLLLEKIKNARD